MSSETVLRLRLATVLRGEFDLGHRVQVSREGVAVHQGTRPRPQTWRPHMHRQPRLIPRPPQEKAGREAADDQQAFHRLRTYRDMPPCPKCGWRPPLRELQRVQHLSDLLRDGSSGGGGEGDPPTTS